MLNMGVFAQEAAEEFTTDTFENYVADSAAEAIEQLYKFGMAKEDIYRNALRQVLAEHPELLDSALKGMFGNLDANSEYYTKEEFDALLEYLNNEFSGIGVQVMAVEEGLRVVSVVPDSPAAAAGMRSEDIIIVIDGVELAGMTLDEAKQYILGEPGTQLAVGYLRGGEYLESLLTREMIVEESGFYQIIEDGTIGYIMLYSFDGHSAEFVDRALAEFDQNGVTKVIMDLRNNPGGTISEFVKICERFIPAGPVIHLEYNDETQNEVYYSHLEQTKYELAVLINENSASAAEAFTGAVQDTRAGVVIGVQSYGKGTKQMVSRIISGGGIRLTDAEYLTTNKRHINGVGITPDVVVENPVVPYDRKYFEPLTHDRVLSVGDTGKDVLCFEQRLHTLGVLEQLPDETYDQDTFDAVKLFQELTGLFPYGVLDLTTQMRIESVISSGNIPLDKQLEKAVELLSTGTGGQYMTGGVDE